MKPPDLNKLAKSVFSFIKESKVTSRVDLNIHFKASSDLRAGTNLTEVLKSLIHFGHIERHLEGTTVYFWVSGYDSGKAADRNPVHNPPHDDYLLMASRPQAPAFNLSQLQSTLAAPLDTKPLVDRKHESSPPSADTPADTPDSRSGENALSSVSALVPELKALSLDKALLRLADELPFFLRSFVQQLLNCDPKVLGLRCSVLVRKGKLNCSTDNPLVYWSPNKPTPADTVQATFDSPLVAVKRRPKKSEGAPTHQPVEATPQKLCKSPLNNPVPSQEDLALFMTDRGFALTLNGELTQLSADLSLKVLRCTLQLNVPAAIAALEAQSLKNINPLKVDNET